MKMKWDIEMEETQIIPNIKLNFYLFFFYLKAYINILASLNFQH